MKDENPTLEMKASEKIKELRRIHDKASKIKQEAERQKNRIQKKKESEVQALEKGWNEIRKSMTIDEFLALTPRDVRPTLIRLKVERSSGEEMVLLQMKEVPCCAVLVWTTRHNTQYSVGLGREGFAQNYYSLACGCCSPESGALKYPFEDRKSPECKAWEASPAYKEWKKKCEAELKAKIGAACAKAGISLIFVRKAGDWIENIGRIKGIGYVEGGEFRDTLLRFCGSDRVEKIMDTLGGDLR